jgi:hypothetical protein
LRASGFSLVSPARACLPVRPSTGFAAVFSSTGKRRKGERSCHEEVRTQPTLPTAISAAIWPLFNVGEAKYRGKCCQIFSRC